MELANSRYGFRGIELNMHPRLAALQKRLAAEKKARAAKPAGDAGLGDAIKALVQAQVAEAMAEQRSQDKAAHRMRKLFESEPVAPGPAPVTPTPAAPAATAPRPTAIDIQIHRDGAGLARSITMGGQLFKIHRTADGAIARLTPDDGGTTK